jgi:hypothetical protein
MCILGRLSSIAIAALLLVGCRNDPIAFRGDGVLTDAGLWSYPRYQIAFPPVLLQQGYEAVFRFRGAPEVRMWMGLVVVDPATGRAAKMNMSETAWETCMIRVKILRESGESLADLQAALKDWKIDQSPSRTMLWHQQLRDLPFDRRHFYEVTINVSGLESYGALLTLRPTLQGGGNELP